jgi:hypothetical protein
MTANSVVYQFIWDFNREIHISHGHLIKFNGFFFHKKRVNKGFFKEILNNELLVIKKCF